ncbi:MAG: PHP-associated domain-containing protein [Verrucomicrobiota bacterium]
MPVYTVDFHTHCKGDPIDHLSHSVGQHIDAAVAAGLDALAITWHTKVFDQPKWIKRAAQRGLLLIPGVEVNLERKYHTLVLNVTPEEVSGHASVAELRDLRERRGPDILIIAPHPYYLIGGSLGKMLDRHADLFDAVEWCHLHCDAVPGKINPNERARRWARRHGKPILQCSDAHVASAVGRWPSRIEAEAPTPRALFDAARAGRVEFEPESITVRETARKVGKVAWDYTKGAFGAGSVARNRKARREHAGRPTGRQVRSVDAVNT